MSRMTSSLAAASLVASLSLIVACEGPEGPEGPQGPAGPAGADGADGTDGTDGADGTDGTDGTNGTNGTDGTDGMDGADGMDGMDGTNGGTVVISETANRGLSISPVAIDVPALVGAGMTGDDIEQIGRGSYLVNAALDCVGCHSNPADPAQYLSGGNPFATPGFTVYTRNLTPDATTGLTLTEAEFIETMQTGRDWDVSAGDESLVVMPWVNYRWLHEDDLKAVYAYLQQIPAVSNAVPANTNRPAIPPTALPTEFTNVSSTDRALPAANNPDPDRVIRGIAIDWLDTPADFDTWSPENQALYGRGSYLVMGGLCGECHTPRDNAGALREDDAYLTGGQVFEVPAGLQGVIGQTRGMSANLVGETNGLSTSFFDFYGYLNSGLSRHGMPLGFPMPFDKLQNLSLWDLESLFTYLTNQRGNTHVTGRDPATQPPARPCTVATQADDCFNGETCDATTLECTGGACTTDEDCSACHTCTGNTNTTCEAPPALDSGCPVAGI